MRTVEHYFNAYGGYSPNPIVFLAAAAMRSAKARLVTGAVLPVFNNQLKLAGEIGMLDAISGGRLDVGFARAFLPHEFARFGISVNESRARFDEGVEQVRLLLAQENVEEVLPLPADFTGDGNLFMLRVRGTSMIEAGILDGDFIVARSQTTAETGDIVVAGIPGDEATVKTYRNEGSRVVLVPSNPSLEPMVFDPSEVAIFGKVVTVMRKL